MSGDKTEKATPRRRREARKKGQVVKSMELNSAVVLLLLYLGFKLFGAFILKNLNTMVTDFLSDNYISDAMDFGTDAKMIYISALKYYVIICAPFFAIAVITAVVINYLQVGFMFLPNLLAMRFDRINPFSGLKRIFSMRAFVDFLKSILKLIIVGTVVYNEFKKSFDTIPNLIYIDLMEGSILIWTSIMNIMWKSGLALLVFGLFDYGYQWWEYEKSIRMTKEEVKQEYKLLEGDPQIKSRIKRVQRQMAMSRMMQKVPSADVIITNPTHYAVALEYNEKKGKAPVVIAKGKDLVALRIKEEAKKHNVEIVENKPLAQTLFKTTEIDQEIPEDLYQAVAEILAVIYRAKLRQN